MLYRRSVSTYLITLAGMILAAGSARAQTIWYVDDDAPGDPGPGDPSVSDPLEDGSAEHPFDAIQEGIDAAIDGDVVLVGDGRYAGEGNKNLDYGGRAITVRSENGPEDCVIDCEGGRGFYFHSDETVDAVVDGFTVTDAHAEYPDGAILCDWASATITNCIITGNTGSGIRCGFSSPVIRGCTIVGNMSDYQGGGILTFGGSVSIVRCTITANSARLRGGGAYFRGGSSTIVDSIIEGNSAGQDAGVSYGCGHRDAVISNCTIVGNMAEYSGGGIGARTAGVTIANCSILENSAGFGGGGAYLGGNHTTVVDCTIAGNTVEDGFGGALYFPGGNAAVANCILWGDSATRGPEIALGHDLSLPPHVTVSHTDVEWGEAAVYVEDGCTLTWGPGNLDADPLFVDPDGPDDEPNTWEDNDFRLAGGSPCIDAGCNCGVPPDSADLDADGDLDEYTPLDLDGEGRFFDDPDTPDSGSGLPPVVDMGAYEFGGSEAAPCRGDLNDTRTVDIADLAILINHYRMTGVTGADGDLDCDGDVDLSDLAGLLARYGSACE